MQVYGRESSQGVVMAKRPVREIILNQLSNMIQMMEWPADNLDYHGYKDVTKGDIKQIFDDEKDAVCKWLADKKD